jgi:hypothetical protein
MIFVRQGEAKHPSRARPQTILAVVFGMDLQPIAIMLQFVRPARSCRGCLTTIGRHGWMKAAGAFNGLPRELRNTMQWI